MMLTKTTAEPIHTVTKDWDCRVCGVALTTDNWHLSGQKEGNYICKKCKIEQVRLRRENYPENAKAIWTRSGRKHGMRPFYENKECPAYLGIHVAEQVLRRVFKNVVSMPINNPGFDFVCNRGKKIDAKSACMNTQGRWMFAIRHNTIADHFLCLAFDNREDLNPLYVWLLPGDRFNDLFTASVCPTTVGKRDEYKLDISKLSLCCDTIRGE